MGNALFIVWREAIEAMLVVGILQGWLSAGGDLAASVRRRAMACLWGGVAGGVLLAMGLAGILLGLQEWADGSELEWLQVMLPMLAAGLIFQMVWWMRRHGAGLKQELEGGASAATHASRWAGLALLSAVAVGREGAETVVFLYGAAVGRGMTDMLVGGLMGLILAFACYALLVRGGRWISWRLFFRFTEFLLLLLGGALLVDACEKLVGLGVLPALADPVWDTSNWFDDSSRIGGLIAGFTGWRTRPVGVSYLALLCWWLLAWFWVLRRGPQRKSRPA